MVTYDFTLEYFRFHLYDENKIIFIGWYRDDNPQHRYLTMYLDDVQLEVTYNNKKGIPIRQKYMHYVAGINEEVNAVVTLPEQWKQAKELKVYCVHGEQRTLVGRFKTELLMRRQQQVSSNIESRQYAEDRLELTGWAISDGVVEYSLLDRKGKKVKCQVARNYRRDVQSVYDEASEGYEAGFKVSAHISKEEAGSLVLCCGEKKTVYNLAVKNLSIAGEDNNIFAKVINYYQQYGLLQTVNRVKVKLFGRNRVNEYKLWQKRYGIKPEELQAQRNTSLEYQPKFSIVIPLYNTKPGYFKEMVDSVLNQTYGNWELCLADGTGPETPLLSLLEEYASKDSRIRYKVLQENKGISENTNAAIEMAEGDFIVFADHDDILPENALFECAHALNEDKTIDVIYSDEDKVDMNGKKFFEPHFKSDFNIDLLCSMNYICHLFVVKRELMEQVGLLRKEFDGAQDHDFILRCTEAAKNIKHIPKILYHWRCHRNSTAENPESKRYAFEAGCRAVEEHYKRLGIPAEVSHGQFYGMYKTKFLWQDKPLISIIIPNKDHVEDLRRCINSIEEKSTYRNFEFVIVENNSEEPETFAYYRELEQRENVQVLYYKEEFNYSKINNFGVDYAKGEYILLLNNDTEMINEDCLWEMLGYCMREDVGIVGARLYYEDDTIQHAGVVLGFGGMAGHAFVGQSRFDNGYFSRIICAQDYSAVTAACLMTKKSVYEEVQGLNEEFQVAFNDIDYCMKVRALGKLIVYNPAAELYHYESKSRGTEDTPEKIERFNSEVARFIERWNQQLEQGDPYYNPNLTLDKADFSLKM